jgi:hypothetical protein
MRVRLLVALSLLTLVAAACTSSTASAPDATDRTISTETLVLGTAEGPLVVQVPSGSVLFEGRSAVSSLGGAWVLSAVTSADRTLLEAREGSTGRIVSTATVPGDVEARIVSESGLAVALMEPLPEGWDPAVPLPRARTTIVVADPTGVDEPRMFDLRGNFEPEAFSTDDDELFLIQHLPAQAPTAYRVVALDLRRERILPVFGPFKGPAERMPGTRLSQLLAPDADQLYTLYTSAKPGYAPHGAPVPGTAAVSFVHVLSLEDGWAHCVGLPKAMWDRPAYEQAMAVTPDGTHLLVVDAGRGLVAVMDTESLGVRTVPVALPFEGTIARTSAQISPDGRTLYLAMADTDNTAATAGDESSTVVALDTTTFEVRHTWRLPGVVSGLGVSSDGTSVYAAVGGHVAVLDAGSGLELGQILLPTERPVVQVIPIAA